MTQYMRVSSPLEQKFKLSIATMASGMSEKTLWSLVICLLSHIFVCLFDKLNVQV